MSGQDILRAKEKKGNNSNKGTVNFSRLTRTHRSHNTEFHETLRSWNVENVDFGAKVNIQLNSSNLIQDMALVLKLKESAGSYCAGFGAQCVKEITFRFNGRDVNRYFYKAPLFTCLQNFEHDVDRAELLKICGGAAGGGARKAVVPIFSWHDSFSEGNDIRHRRPWKNAFNGKLQLEIQFHEKAYCTDGNADCQIESCEFVHTEVLVPARLEAALSRPVTEAPRIQYNQLENISLIANTKLEVDISSMTAGGNTRCVYMYFRSATSGADLAFPDDDCKMPDRVALKINGITVIEEQQPVMDWSQWTKGIHPRAGRCYILSFAERPQDSSSSGYLPSSTDSCALELTIASTCVCDLYFQYEKMVRIDAQGRYTSSDQ